MNPRHGFRRNLFLFSAAGFLGDSTRIAVAQGSTDGDWTTSGPAGADVAALVSDPMNSLRLFAGTELGVFRTDDGGGAWPASPAGPTNIVALALDPTNPNHVWAGTNAGVAL